jgi:hypothetical protein
MLKMATTVISGVGGISQMMFSWHVSLLCIKFEFTDRGHVEIQKTIEYLDWNLRSVSLGQSLATTVVMIEKPGS